MQLLESSFDLMSNPLFSITPRASWMMPTPFGLNDAVVIRKRIKPTPKIIEVPVFIEARTATQRKATLKSN